MKDKKKKKKGQKTEDAPIREEAVEAIEDVGDPSNEDQAFDIVKTESFTLAKSEKSYSVGMLERELLKRFPKQDAEPWDRCGLLVGNPTKQAFGIAIALDPTVEAIKKAAQIGADVLLTHHPLFLDAPTKFSPAKSAAIVDGAGVWQAIESGVAVMSFHTCLDVSLQAQHALPSILGLSYKGKLACPIDSDKSKGYGQICEIPQDSGKPMTLGRLAAKCLSIFGVAPKVWGNKDASVESAVCALGSAGNVAYRALELDCDVLICGELKYHTALELANAGLTIIELGHDVSEFPLTGVLYNAMLKIGYKDNSLAIIDQNDNWTYPESIRL